MFIKNIVYIALNGRQRKKPFIFLQYTLTKTNKIDLKIFESFWGLFDLLKNVSVLNITTLFFSKASKLTFPAII